MFTTGTFWNFDLYFYVIHDNQNFYCFLYYIFRNASLEQKGIRAPTAYKTGTTICGVIYKVAASKLLSKDIYISWISIPGPKKIMSI